MTTKLKNPAPTSFTVSAIEEYGQSSLSLRQWLIVRISDGQRLVFWGRASNHANIDAIQKQTPPFKVNCQTYTTSKPGIHWAVGVETPLHID
jgi:hypothetical protein